MDILATQALAVTQVIAEVVLVDILVTPASVATLDTLARAGIQAPVVIQVTAEVESVVIRVTLEPAVILVILV